MDERTWAERDEIFQRGGQIFLGYPFGFYFGSNFGVRFSIDVIFVCMQNFGISDVDPSNEGT